MAPLTFPAPDRSLRGRSRELDRLASLVGERGPGAIALVGPGGSGKSMLAGALGHHVANRFQGGIHWFRVGAWSSATLLSMLAVRFGTGRDRLVSGLRTHLKRRGRTFVVLDNHEDDEAVADLINTLASTPVFWVVTARRCLLAGVTIYPVTPPMVLDGTAPYASVATLTSLLRHNPLSLSIADALVQDGVVTAAALGRTLRAQGAARVQVIEDEDDLPEVRLLVEYAFDRLPPAAKRLVAVLAHSEGDHVDRDSLLRLGRATRSPFALDQLARWRLVQEPFDGRFTVHATVRRALRGRTRGDPVRLFQHYVTMLERAPERLDAEQTHLFAAMDHAAEAGTLEDRLRLAHLLRNLRL